MIKTIAIVILAIALVGITLCYIFDRIRTAKDLAEIDEIVDRMNKNLEDSQQHAYDILKEWAESMDKHEKAYNDLLKKNNELSLEIERKNIEIERLNQLIDSAKSSYDLFKIERIDTSKGPDCKEDSTNGDETIPLQS